MRGAIRSVGGCSHSLRSPPLSSTPRHQALEAVSWLAVVLIVVLLLPVVVLPQLDGAACGLPLGAEGQGEGDGFH